MQQQVRPFIRILAAGGGDLLIRYAQQARGRVIYLHIGDAARLFAGGGLGQRPDIRVVRVNAPGHHADDVEGIGQKPGALIHRHPPAFFFVNVKHMPDQRIIEYIFGDGIHRVFKHLFFYAQLLFQVIHLFGGHPGLFHGLARLFVGQHAVQYRAHAGRRNHGLFTVNLQGRGHIVHPVFIRLNVLRRFLAGDDPANALIPGSGGDPEVPVGYNAKARPGLCIRVPRGEEHRQGGHPGGIVLLRTDTQLFRQLIYLLDHRLGALVKGLFDYGVPGFDAVGRLLQSQGGYRHPRHNRQIQRSQCRQRQETYPDPGKNIRQPGKAGHRNHSLFGGRQNALHVHSPGYGISNPVYLGPGLVLQEWALFQIFYFLHLTGHIQQHLFGPGIGVLVYLGSGKVQSLHLPGQPG